MNANTPRTIQTAEQAREWCDREILLHQQRTKKSEVEYAVAQQSKCWQYQDYNRLNYWECVERRIIAGERMQPACGTEHDIRHGPKTTVFHNGVNMMVDDMDFWLLP